MKNNFFVFILLFCLVGCTVNKTTEKELVDYVNTRIGNISILLVPTFPTTHLPNSMLRMIPPHTEFVTDRMPGLPLNVPSHRQGDVLHLMPFCGSSDPLPVNIQYRYDQEISTPYRYSVLLDDFDIYVDFAPASKSAIYTFTYEKEGPRYVMLRTVRNGELSIEKNVMTGYENYRGTKHYFYLEFEQSPVETGKVEAGNRSVPYARFSDEVTTVKLRYGISYISVEQAKKNLEKEIRDYDVANLAQQARSVWNKTLGKIEVKGGTEDQKTTFYTALYRAHERMIHISEDGKYYNGFDGKVHDDEGIAFWTDDWIWDNYHALHPLQTILNPADQAEKMTSYIRMCEQSPEKWMPTFPGVFGDAHCMNGNHAAVMFIDAWNKGIKFDLEKAFEGMKNTVMTETMIPWRRAPKTELDDFYHKNGWFPALHPDEKETVALVDAFEQRNAVAVTQAASYDDWSIAQMAKHLGKKEDYNFFIKRAFNYRHLFNKETGFFHPKDKHGKFIEPFDYIFSGGIGSRAYYDENNAWTYIWDVHHNIADLIDLFGGRQPFIDKLDRLFVEDLKISKWQYYAVQPDATGNVGQFVMGNEPSFHIPYLYNYAGQPWKTQKRIRMLMESWFRNDLMGIPGDEDGGGMTAFYVFSAMGFYPVSAGIPAYNIGSPIFEEVTIHLDNGKKFIIKAPGSSWSNKYIISAKMNEKSLDRPWFVHDDIVSGGVLELEMADRPNKQWGIAPDAVPPSEGIEIKYLE
ncbi:MAG: GH92 family glycosyl hydrolase [Bacteroidales bacterium]|jgi:predicted alpha-1,2-mannosidase|nr:GH92 family glycosyl hydrolase [Bacteroidales bacterium]